MTPPKMMCRPPNPAPISQLPHAAGPNSAAAPAAMKHTPITGTTRTENAPPVTNPVPYSSSQVPGSACHNPARYSATVRSPPTTIGGRKLSPKRRPGPERIGSFTAYAFRTIADPPIVSATRASPSHTDRHLAPSRDGGEGAGALHRLPDVAEVVERAVAQRLGRAHRAAS